MSEDGHPTWGFGETLRRRRLEKKVKAKQKQSIPEIIEWIESLEEEVELLRNR